MAAQSKSLKQIRNVLSRIIAYLVVIGGAPADIETYRQMAEKLGLTGRVHFLGSRPIAHLGAYLAQADVLASHSGQNTPMKVYSYMQAARGFLLRISAPIPERSIGIAQSSLRRMPRPSQQGLTVCSTTAHIGRGLDFARAKKWSGSTR